MREFSDSVVREFIRQSSFSAVAVEVTSLYIRAKSVTVEEKTLIVQYGTERVLDSH
jgi:hypothetical protein